MFRVLRNARLADGRVVDVHTSDGFIKAVEPAGSDTGGAAKVDDLATWLLLPAMVEPHAHLDKALTAEAVPNPTGDLAGAIRAWTKASRAGQFNHGDTVERAAKAMELLVAHGVTAVRSHINVLPDIGANSLIAVREAAQRFEGLLDVQLVALTATPMTGFDSSDNREALDAALEVGVELVGGCPHLDPDGPGLIAYALKQATDAGIDVDLHVDEVLDPEVSNLRELARQVIDTGFEGRVAASHCVSLGVQTPDVQAAVAAEVAEAGIAVFPLPQTNLFLQGREIPSATPRGLTAVRALTDAGVLVAAGADNVQDPFNLVGRSDPLETAALMVMAGHELPEPAYDMVSNNAREAIGLPRVAVEVGSPADLVAIEAASTRAAIADAPMSRRVYRAGRLVASTDQTTTLHR